MSNNPYPYVRPFLVLDPEGRYMYRLEEDFDFSPFDQVTTYSGQNSEMPASLWSAPYPRYSLPIPANPMRPLQPSDLTAYRAPWAPHSGSMDEERPAGAAGQHHRNSDIPVVALKAPKF